MNLKACIVALGILLGLVVCAFELAKDAGDLVGKDIVEGRYTAIVTALSTVGLVYGTRDVISRVKKLRRAEVLLPLFGMSIAAGAMLQVVLLVRAFTEPSMNLLVAEALLITLGFLASTGIAAVAPRRAQSGSPLFDWAENRARQARWEAEAVRQQAERERQREEDRRWRLANPEMARAMDAEARIPLSVRIRSGMV